MEPSDDRRKGFQVRELTPEEQATSDAVLSVESVRSIARQLHQKCEAELLVNPEKVKRELRDLEAIAQSMIICDN